MPHAGDSRAPQIPAGDTSPTFIVGDNGADTQGTFGGFNCEAFTSANVGPVRQGMAETSLEAFHSLPVKACLQRRERELMALFTGPGVAFTREQLAARLGWKEASVCGRANSLVTKGALTEIDGGKTDSGRSAKLLQLPRSEQGELVERGA